MSRRRRYSKRGGQWLSVFAVAFGLGLFLSFFLSARFVLFLAAIALIYTGITYRC